jgi:hypothetical protein
MKTPTLVGLGNEKRPSLIIVISTRAICPFSSITDGRVAKELI